MSWLITSSDWFPEKSMTLSRNKEFNRQPSFTNYDSKQAYLIVLEPMGSWLFVRPISISGFCGLIPESRLNDLHLLVLLKKAPIWWKVEAYHEKLFREF